MQIPSLPDAESLQDDADALCAAIDHVLALQGQYADVIKKLLASEDPANGIFHAASIHEAKKTKMLLQYQHDLYLARRNRLLLEEEQI